MRAGEHELISVDDHIVEPPDLWHKRLPARFLDVGPRVVDLDAELEQQDDDLPFDTSPVTTYGADDSAGRQAWMFDGRLYPVVGLSAVTGRSTDADATNPARFDLLQPGFHDIDARLAEMDIDGVRAQVNFPTFCGLAGERFLGVADRELALACVRVWNDFMVDEWCAAVPGRQIPLAILPLWDTVAAANEVRRVAAMGSRVVSLPEDAHQLGLPSLGSRHWDPVWRALADTGLAATIHAGRSHTGPFLRSEVHGQRSGGDQRFDATTVLHELCSSEVFHQFPELRVSLVEAGPGWVQRSLQRMDALWEKHRGFADDEPDERPSDVFRDHVWVCLLDDGSGIDARDLVGPDKLLWASDYPLLHSSFPYSRARVNEATSRWSDEDRAKFASGNARHLFDWSS